MDRRQFLALAGGGIGGVAGCLGVSGSGDGGDGDGEDTGPPLREHPAGADIDAQPRRGEFGGHVVVVFDDPSCPRCAAFAQQVAPSIRENLVSPGDAALVTRSYPVVYPWGEPATAALEATFAREEAAFWTLQDHYFENQETFSADTVLAETESFLAAETDVDGAAVVEAVESGEAEAAVRTDLEAAGAADLPESTPQVLLFREGDYATTVSGSVSYDAIAAALGE